MVRRIGPPTTRAALPRHAPFPTSGRRNRSIRSRDRGRAWTGGEGGGNNLRRTRRAKSGRKGGATGKLFQSVPSSYRGRKERRLSDSFRIQNTDIREPDTRGLPRRSLRGEGRGSDAAGSGLDHTDRGGGQSDGPRPARASISRSKIVSPPGVPLLGHFLPALLLLPARPPASLPVRLLGVHGRGGRHTAQAEPNSRLPPRRVLSPLRGGIERGERRGGRVQGRRIAALVHGETDEIGEERREFSSELHRKGGRLQSGEQQQVGESEYGDVVVTRGYE